MADSLSSEEMRAVEQAAIAAGRVSGATLMERAGEGVVRAIFDTYPELAPKGGLLNHILPGATHRAVVMCGPGNNGGDGFVVARLLKTAGWDVTVFFYGTADALPPDARAAHDDWQALGEITPLPSEPPSAGRLAALYDPHPDLWVDAFFGIGINRPLPESVTNFMHRVYYEQNWCGAPVVAIDIPSGLSADTGQSVQPFHLTADLTVTFHAPKHGHLTGDGPDRCGTLVVADIGL